MKIVSTDYRAVNGVGVVVRTFGCLQSAKAWARDTAHLHDGLKIERVTVTAEVAYTPRVTRRRPDFHAPQWGAVSPVVSA